MKYLDTENNFFGRQDILETLNRRVHDLKEGYRQNIALLGDRYIGKSSIIRNFLTNLEDPDIVAIYLDLENKDFSYFYHKLTTSLLYHFARMNNLPLHEDLAVLMESLKEHIPHTVEVIQRISDDFRKNKQQAAYLGLLTLPEVFTTETDKFCLFIFDEFQYLQDFELPNEFKDLGQKIMTQKRCLYILSSSYESQAVAILSEKLSLLFGSFENIRISPFDLNDSQKFIEWSLDDIKMGATLANFLTDFTGGHPLYLNLICREIIHLCAIHNQREAYMPILAQAVENTIFDKWGVLSRHFELIIQELISPKGSQVVTSILISLSNGNHKPEQILNDIGIRKSQLTQRMNRLSELGVVVKNGTFYHFKDRLLKYWMKYVYQRRLKHIDLTFNILRRQYKEEFQSAVETFKENTRKDFPSRIVELFHCFENDSLSLNGRRYKLPLFKNIERERMANSRGGHFDIITASSDDAQWFIVLKKDHLNENDITTILQKTKQSDQKPQRCLLISLDELDEAARVRALAEKFWIWNKVELDTLLTLYDKPYILK